MHSCCGGFGRVAAAATPTPILKHASPNATPTTLNPLIMLRLQIPAQKLRPSLTGIFNIVPCWTRGTVYPMSGAVNLSNCGDNRALPLREARNRVAGVTFVLQKLEARHTPARPGIPGCRAARTFVTGGAAHCCNTGSWICGPVPSVVLEFLQRIARIRCVPAAHQRRFLLGVEEGDALLQRRGLHLRVVDVAVEIDRAAERHLQFVG
jgi:hypothetical protein